MGKPEAPDYSYQVTLKIAAATIAATQLQQHPCYEGKLGVYSIPMFLKDDPANKSRWPSNTLR